MTKKHLIQLAQIVADTTDIFERERLADAIGEVCKGCSKHFNWVTWYDACDVMHP